MGQRHQIYCFYHEHGNKEITCNAFHNQWLYGTLPLQTVINVARFQKKADPYSKIGRVSFGVPKMLETILSLNTQFCSYTNTFNITEEVCSTESGINPDRGDNNDGITLLYFPQDTTLPIKYCFMFLEAVGEGQTKLHHRVPLSAKQYVESYYPPIGGDNKYETYQIASLIKKVNRCAKLLTQEECYRLLPDWYIRHVKKVDLPLFVGMDIVNKAAFENRVKGKHLQS